MTNRLFFRREPATDRARYSPGFRQEAGRTATLSLSSERRGSTTVVYSPAFPLLTDADNAE